jgi:hypothetical protein
MKTFSTVLESGWATDASLRRELRRARIRLHTNQRTASKPGNAIDLITRGMLKSVESAQVPLLLKRSRCGAGQRSVRWTVHGPRSFIMR